MKYYQKRQPVFTAEMFHSKGNIPKEVRILENGTFIVGTEELYRYIKDGDWIVKDEDGNLNVYSEDQFRKNFELIEES